MLQRKASYEELTDPSNVLVNATLTPRAWRKLLIARARSSYYSLDNDPYNLPDPLGRLHYEILELSGAIGGERRKDLVEVTKTNVAPETALSLNVGDATTHEPRHTGEKKRGLL